MTPTDLLSLAPMTPGDLLRTARSPMNLPEGYLVVDVDKSDDQTLWVCTPNQDDWSALATVKVSSLRPVGAPPRAGSGASSLRPLRSGARMARSRARGRGGAPAPRGRARPPSRA